MVEKQWNNSTNRWYLHHKEHDYKSRKLHSLHRMQVHNEPTKFFFKEANSYDTSKFINIRSPDFARCHLITDKIDTIQVIHEVVQALHTGSKWEVRSEFRVINLKPISFHLVCIVWCIPWSQILQQRELHVYIHCWHASIDMTDDQKGWTSLTYIYIYIPWMHWL